MRQLTNFSQAVLLIDSEKMQLGMNNLLTHACLDVLGTRSCSVVEVSDQGLRMSPDHLALAFERFYRVGASGNTPGTGLA